MKGISGPLNWFLIMLIAASGFHCKDNDDTPPPEIRLIFDNGFTKNNDTLEIGNPVRFRVEVTGSGANVTNFTVKKQFAGGIKTVLDSGMNSTGFVKDFIFYQGVEDRVEWVLAVMDRYRKEASVSLVIHKDPLSQFGGIIEYNNIELGYQDNTATGNFFLPSDGRIFFADSASLFQDLVDVLVYFNYREDQGVMKPSPTFSSPGEETTCTGELYTDYYPSLCNWQTRNYTKWDIRVANGITSEAWNQAHNDSLLIVSYDNVWGKKKYKWAMPGTFIPFQTAAGKTGIIKVEKADTTSTGSLTFSMKIQI